MTVDKIAHRVAADAATADWRELLDAVDAVTKLAARLRESPELATRAFGDEILAVLAAPLGSPVRFGPYSVLELVAGEDG